MDYDYLAPITFVPCLIIGITIWMYFVIGIDAAAVFFTIMIYTFGLILLSVF